MGGANALIVLIVFAVLLLLYVIILVKGYFIKYDTVVAFTGGLGTGKSFLSVQTAIQELNKNRFKTRVYNFFHRKNKLPLPMLYSSIPIRISKHEWSLVLTSDMLTLQTRIIPGSIVFIDEIDVFCNQFSFANENVIECSNKKDLSAKRSGASDYDSGLVDEEIRLFRHLFSSKLCEAKLICNTQATSNITTIIRRRMNTVFVLSTFRVHKFPLLGKIPPFKWLNFYTVECRNITITDEITNTSDGNAEDNMRVVFGWMPHIRHYDTHCYSDRAEGIPFALSEEWLGYKTLRLLKCPIDRLKNKSKKE